MGSHRVPAELVCSDFADTGTSDSDCGSQTEEKDRGSENKIPNVTENVCG